MPANYVVLNGPKGAPGATGSYDGVVGVNNNNDFTAVSFTQAPFTIVNNGTVPGTPNGNNFNAVSPGFFSTLGIRLFAGRDFDALDSRPPGEAGSRSVIVN